MKAEVIRSFRDKKTKERYKIGQILEVEETRFNEMNSTKFGDLVKKVEEYKAEAEVEVEAKVEVKEKKATKPKAKKEK